MKFRNRLRTVRNRGKLLALNRNSVPRLSVYRSNAFIYAQIIDDSRSITIVSCDDRSMDRKLDKTNRAKLVGKQIADAAKGKKITNIIFDRGGYFYHGRIKALAESARENGLKFQ